MKRGNGFGSVIKLGGKRRRPYAARITQGWTEEGKQIVKYIGYYATKREATQALEAYNTDPYDIDTAKITLLEVWDRWEKEQNLSPSNFRTYRSAFRKADHLHNIPFAQLRLPHLEGGMKMQTRTMQASYKNVMTGLYRYAMKYDIVQKNVAEFLKPETFESKERNIFTPDHVQKLWDNVDNHPLADMPLIMLYTGIRINEILKLKCSDVNLEERYFITGSKTAAGKNRMIPIHDKILPLIEKRMSNGHKYLVTHIDGHQIKDKSYREKEWVWTVNKVLGAVYTPHETRHSFITYMVRSGVSRTALQRIVGHAVREVTDIYIHNSPEELLKAVNQLEYK